MIITTKNPEGAQARRTAELEAALTQSRAQTARLERVLRLEARVRAADDRRELGYVLLNDATAAMEYRQAALWWRAADDAGPGRIEGLSGVSDPVRNAAFPAWLVKMLGRFADGAQPAQGANEGAAAVKPGAVVPFTIPEPSAHDREMAAEYLPPEALWVELPLKAPEGRTAPAIRAALVYWRADPFTAVDRAVMGILAQSFGDAWSALPAGRTDWLGEGAVKRSSNRLLVWSRRRWVRAAAAVFVLAVLAIPMRQSVLAPAEVTAKHPFAVRAPLAGVVEEITVAPNAPVKAGDLLVRMDARELRGQLQAARQSLSVAEAEYRQSQQQAFFDERSKMALGVLLRRRDQAAAEVEFLKGELARTEIRAERAGVAVFSDPQEWIGRPVAVGERILMVADPKDVELEAEIPVGDAVKLEKGSDVLFFMNAEPTAPWDAKLLEVAYRAAPTAEGALAYKARAEIVPDPDRPEALQVGLKGTAKLYGERTCLGLYLLRRPLAALRLWLGF